MLHAGFICPGHWGAPVSDRRCGTPIVRVNAIETVPVRGPCMRKTSREPFSYAAFAAYAACLRREYLSKMKLPDSVRPRARWNLPEAATPLTLMVSFRAGLLHFIFVQILNSGTGAGSARCQSAAITRPDQACISAGPRSGTTEMQTARQENRMFRS